MEFADGRRLYRDAKSWVEKMSSREHPEAGRMHGMFQERGFAIKPRCRYVEVKRAITFSRCCMITTKLSFKSVLVRMSRRECCCFSRLLICQDVCRIHLLSNIDYYMFR